MGCDDKCGCPVPCPGPGGGGCRCASTERSGGEHCGCNPCSCRREPAPPSGRDNRRAGCCCGDACACASCASTSTTA
ncbi:hypothetical protein GUJ93_ZPchr0012g20282 [Zizania palustris]|uniref:Uncharacterized protein n=1 Tax=Zizania palustris TaxID=103762 RepID=A0A8J5WJH5_ZIZPA|nr:hypothetical protein GUJ93_ZPchr0012g20282 [Zizania palustris]